MRCVLSETALPDIGNPDQDPMRYLGYPRGGVDIHGLFGCKPLGLDPAVVVAVVAVMVKIEKGINTIAWNNQQNHVLSESNLVKKMS